MICITCGTGMKHISDDLWQCENCELVSSDIKPDITLYDKSYHTKYVRYSKTPLGDSINNLRLINITAVAPRIPIILDFGCGCGSFVDYCHSCNLEAKGFDVNPYSGYCEISNLFNGHNIVTFWDSLEHLSNPVDVIKGLDAETVLISAPSIDDIKGEIQELTLWHHYYPGEHVHYFNKKSLSILLESLGYSIRVSNYSESVYRTSGSDKNILTIGGIKNG